MNKIILILIIGSALLCGCSKNEPPVSSMVPSIKKNQNPPMKVMGGGDDDHPIVRHFTTDEEHSPLSNSIIKYINGSDTVTGTTDALGVYQFTLPYTGEWTLKITNQPNYLDLNTSAEIVDSFTIRTDILTLVP